MKVYVLINATALPGKSSEARKAALATVQYLNENNKYIGKYEIVTPETGPNSRFIGCVITRRWRIKNTMLN